jgi:hypothetical protein
MTGIATNQEFDPALHPIGHSLAIELLRTDPSLYRGDTSTTLSPVPATTESFDWFEADAA